MDRTFFALFGHGTVGPDTPRMAKPHYRVMKIECYLSAFEVKFLPLHTNKPQYTMDIAQNRRRENIAEYILYLWQIEDLLRALQFSPEAIWSQLVAKRDADPEHKQEIFLWYMELCNLLREEGKEQNGHLDHTLHLIADLQNLHLQLMQLPVGEEYRRRFARLMPALPRLREVLHKPDTSDIELCFRALYAVMLYRIKGDGGNRAVTDTIELISPVIAELSKIFRQVERGEIDLFKGE